MWDGRRQTRHQQNNKVELYLGLGSNQGDRAQNIEHAVSMLNVELKTPYKAISSLLETEPWRFESQEKFMNAVVLYELELPEGYNPEAEGLMILEICKDIERRMGRMGEPLYNERGERIYADRPIDIDILYYNDLVVDSADLILPHPRLHQRRFTLLPLCEIAPDYIHPIVKCSNMELLSRCDDMSIVRLYK